MEMEQLQNTAKEFLQSATVNQLKEKLRNLDLSTAGTKAVLILRLEEGWKSLDEDALRENIVQSTSGDVDDSYEDNGDQTVSINGNEENSDDLENEIRKLREIIEKKNKIAELRKQLVSLSEQEVSQSKSYLFNFRDVESSLPNFSGDDNYLITKWIANFEECADTMDWDQKMRFVYAKRLMTGTAKLFLRTITSGSWCDLKIKLIKEFKKKVTIADVHSQLRNRRKRQEETHQQYVLAMQEIASFADVDETDIVQYVVNGIGDTVNNKMILYNADTLIELKIALRKYEKFKINYNTPEIDTSKTYAAASRSYKPRQQNQQHVKCFNCSEYGHISTRCPRQRRERGACFKCGQQGHRAPDCQHPKVISLVKSSVDVQASGSPASSTTLTTHRFEKNINFKFFKNDVDPSCNFTSLSLLDSGSPISFIQQQYLPYHLINYVNGDKYKFSGINNSKLSIVGTVKSLIEFQNKSCILNMFVVKDQTMNNCIILGRDFMNQMDLNLIVQNEQDDLDSRKKNCIHEAGMTDDSDDFLENILHIDIFEDDTIEGKLNINENLENNVKKRITEIMKQTWTKPVVKLGVEKVSNSTIEIDIKLSKEVPFYCTPRRLPYVHKTELKEILTDLLNRNIIRESSSPYASPIVLVKKKNGESRLCIDYRELNKLTFRHNYPLPLIEDLIDQLRNKNYFTVLDLRSGFHNVNIALDSIKFTAFVTPLGHFEFLKMPFGLKNGPAYFQKYINHIFKELLASGLLLIYLDDLLIATETIEKHFEILEQVVELLQKFSLELRYDKCKFLYEEITYLGYTIDCHGIRPGIENLRAVQDYPIPMNIKAVHSFLGLCAYFRKFINNFAILAKPLYDLLKKDSEFKFEEGEMAAYEMLKFKLLETPILSIYSPTNETELHCDASSQGYGAILMQKQSDNKFHPVFYFSKRCTDAESRYHSYELETLAIIYALRRFRIYLIGLEFKIITDCQALTLTLNKKLLNPRISRWALELQNFNYRVEHRASTRMSHVDALSRNTNILVISDDPFEIALASAQQNDAIIKDIVSKLEKSESSLYELNNGLVYRKNKDNLLFYVPGNMESRIIQTHHDNLCHVGTAKCYEYLRKSYWFPDMKNKIKAHIATCLKCIYYSPISGKVEGRLHNIPKGEAPFDTLHIDHYGPLPTTMNKKKHIFLVVDGFTKFSKLYAVKSTQTKEVISCLESYFSTYSRPNRIISDRGSCFTSQEFANFMSDNNITHIKVATLSPQSNGQVERINRVLTPMLAKETEIGTTGNWSKNISKVEFALNNSINRTTKFCPSMLLFGVPQKGLICDNIKEFLDQNINYNRDLTIIRKEASGSMENAQNYNKVRYDNLHKAPNVYSKGDYVMLKNIDTTAGVNKKLLAKYRGPYEVLEVLPHDRYVVKDIDGIQISRIPYKGVCSPANMKPYIF